MEMLGLKFRKKVSAKNSMFKLIGLMKVLLIFVENN